MFFGRLLLLLVCAACACCGSSQQEVIDAFEAWFTANGGLRAGFKLVPHEGFRRWTIIATEDLREGDILFQVPLSATMYVSYVQLLQHA